MRTIALMMAAATAAPATAGSEKAAAVTIDAVPIHIEEWLGADSYPPEAIRNGEQGRLVAIVSIDATGKPTACRIDVSIGSPALERGTCSVVLARARFEPARDAKGRAVASDLRMPVRWILPESGDERQPSGPLDMIHLVTVGADDRTLACEITVDGKPQPPAPDQCGGPDSDPADLRRRLAIIGGYRMRMDVSIRHGATPPALPAAPVAGRMLTLHEVRQTIDAQGVPSRCTVTVSGEWREQAMQHLDKTACESEARFYPVVGPDGNPVSAQVLVAVRVTLLPSPN